MYSPLAAGQIITACAVLHNIMIDANYPLPDMDEEDDEDEEILGQDECPIAETNVGQALRRNVIRDYFVV